jgi:hypothetical protein
MAATCHPSVVFVICALSAETLISARTVSRLESTLTTLCSRCAKPSMPPLSWSASTSTSTLRSPDQKTRMNKR